MKAEDQYHVGIVVEDLDSTLHELSALFGYEWCEEFNGPNPVTLPTGDTTIPLRFTYSTTAPHVEIIQEVPGTLWVPATGSGIHHLGYWSDDVAGDSAELASRGAPMEAMGTAPDGSALWAYHRSPTGPRIELVNRMVQPMMEQWWASGVMPS